MKSNDKSNKSLKITGGAIGVIGAVSVGQWPDHAVPFQMALYSGMVLIPFLFGFWKDRHRANFWTGVGLLILLHCVTLILIHSYFPFRTILLILPIVLIEGTILAIVMLKSLGY
ncbi:MULTISPECIES: hypothetical protein [Acidobacteriaceae]|uniref:hypothetical protein n=1 Tax=Acidobacteriaceae TaxID=204434 RepID=UPI00131B0F1D|nr:MULTISPECIES: hypothetical protein [Acidobacteriaceae]MDW5264240.1 hypothetical protein [Edaphobacter sp.]